MGTTAAFVSALIDTAADRSRPQCSFGSVEEAQNLAFYRLQQQTMDKIVAAMVTSRDSGMVQLDVQDDRCSDWLQSIGFRVYSNRDRAFATWGPFPKLAGWTARQ